MAALLLARGINDVIISPGSRNGPLIHTFAGSGQFNCRNIVDERSAAYFAIGLSQATRKPVVLTCSSGTAALNYAPAIAEAFALNIPLIVLTADRPGYWIDQLESQCIRQQNIYKDFVKKEITLPLEETEKGLWHAGRMVNECINLSVSGTPGPVHINIPLEEPLHGLTDVEIPRVKVIDVSPSIQGITENEAEKLVSVFNKAEKVLILAGQQRPDHRLEKILHELSGKTGAVILKEHLANINSPHFCSSVDTIMASILDRPEEFIPDLLISCGGQFVSKSLKQFLRKNKPSSHWHLSLSSEHFDTYQSLTKVIGMDTTGFFGQLLPLTGPKGKSYLERWKKQEAFVNRRRDLFIKESPFCDLKVFGQINRAIPKGSVIHLGNSSPVRYALICDQTEDALYYGNRGTSGIDGPMSVAAGFASVSGLINTVILGDLSFFYDSNALWNKYIGKNFRVIVINNRGGNIFGMINGPSGSPAFEEHFFAGNKFSAEGIAKTFGLDYLQAQDEQSLDAALKDFYRENREKATLLEVFTDPKRNSSFFKELFKNVKS